MTLDLSTVLLQWAAGGLFFCWVTTRRREVALGYGWLLRITYAVLAACALAASIVEDADGAGAVVRELGAAGVVVGAAAALVVSVVRRRAGVRGREAVRAERRARVQAMLRQQRAADAPDDGSGPDRDRVREFPPPLDLIGPAFGLFGLLGAAAVIGGPYPLAMVRLVVGALFLGAVTDAMLLGHWYLVQPGLARDPIRELVVWVAAIFPFEVGALLWPTGMAQVLDGTVDDGWDGLLGWTWVVCAVSTIGLVGATWLALKERAYAAVMAATGLLYLAILTAFGTDLIARAVLAP
jgi:hypothetical protein